MFELTTLNVFRPQRTTVLLAIVAEPVEKPDARLLALHCHSPPTLVSQCISPDHLALIIARSNDLKSFSEQRGSERRLSIRGSLVR